MADGGRAVVRQEHGIWAPVPQGEEEPQVLVEAQPDAGLTHRPSIASAATAAAIDHDLAKLAVRLDGQDRLLRALSATQSDHTQRLTRIEDRLGGLEVRFTGLEERFGGLEEQFGAIVERFGRVEGTVSRVEVGVQAILGLLSNGR